MEHLARKRQKVEEISSEDLVEFEDNAGSLQEIWRNESLFALHGTQDVHDSSAEKNKKRANDDDSGYGEDDGRELDWMLQEDFPSWIAEHFPEFNPSVPSIEDRPSVVEIPNPFLEVVENRHPSLRQTVSILPKDGALDGYIKFRIRSTKPETGESSHRKGLLAQRRLAFHNHHHGVEPEALGASIPLLPPDFDRRCNLDATDNRLLKFYTVAFCGGRTLLTKANFWLVEFTPMALGDECVKHALLAFTAAYVLDYVSTEQLRSRANAHYKKAVNLLSEALSKSENLEVGKGDSLVAAVILLLSDDIVQWELRKSRDSVPRWREGTQTAKMILDISDPGYRYWKAENVQSSTARLANANRVAFMDILALLVTPLNLEDSDSMYPWLLEGTEKEVRKIHDGTGLSPKLLHTFAQITHLAALMVENPDSQVLPHGADEIDVRLHNFKQWSDLSQGYASSESLFSSCIPDAKGKVNNAAKVSDLTGEAWVAAAKLYLHCRFYRKSRSHPVVHGCLDILRRCVELMPSSGPLFTSQSPFCPIFIMGLVSHRDHDRQVVREWFETQCAIAKPRSSVPPVWKTLQALWEWLDTEMHEPPYDDNSPISQRVPWWEHVTARLLETEGQLSLC